MLLFWYSEAKFRWGIQILKNLGTKLEPILKKNGLFCLMPYDLQLAMEDTPVGWEYAS
jgi:hypothetical protein